MESINSAASQTCCHTCHQPLPEYKSIHNPQLEGTLSALDVDSLCPPQYSALDQGSEVQQAASDPDWVYLASKHGPRENFWTRAIKDGDEIWQQYGISEQESDGKPDLFLTCKMMPRKEGNERATRTYCKMVASVMRFHRSDNYCRCRCTFQTLRQPEGLRRCSAKWYHLGTGLTKHAIMHWMRQHDSVYSCGCFGVSTEEDSPLIASGQHVERRNRSDSKALGTNVLRG